MLWKPALKELDHDICHTDALIRAGRLPSLMQVDRDQAIQANGCRCGSRRLRRGALARASGGFCPDFETIAVWESLFWNTLGRCKNCGDDV